MKSIPVKFQNKNKQVLAGILDLPDSPSAFAVYAHCFTCSKDIPAAYHICKSLAKEGVACLRFDFTGLGDSEGGFSETNFTTNIKDIIAASNYLHDNYQGPKLIIGHSLGGTAAIAAVNQLNNVKAVATIASPNKPSHVLGHFEEVQNVLKDKPETSVNILNREFIIKKQLLEDIESYDQVEIIEKLNKPILIMHSPLDKTVSIEEASNLFLGAKHPKSFISLDGIDHLISDKADAEYIAKNIFSWSEKYLS